MAPVQGLGDDMRTDLARRAEDEDAQRLLFRRVARAGGEQGQDNQFQNGLSERGTASEYNVTETPAVGTPQRTSHWLVRRMPLVVGGTFVLLFLVLAVWQLQRGFDKRALRVAYDTPAEAVPGTADLDAMQAIQGHHESALGRRHLGEFLAAIERAQDLFTIGVQSLFIQI